MRCSEAATFAIFTCDGWGMMFATHTSQMVNEGGCGRTVVAGECIIGSPVIPFSFLRPCKYGGLRALSNRCRPFLVRAAGFLEAQVDFGPCLHTSLASPLFGSVLSHTLSWSLLFCTSSLHPWRISSFQITRRPRSLCRAGNLVRNCHLCIFWPRRRRRRICWAACCLPRLVSYRSSIRGLICCQRWTRTF